MVSHPVFRRTLSLGCALILLCAPPFAAGLAVPLLSAPQIAPSGPELWVTPLELDFGEVGVGQTGAQQTVTIHNIGANTLTDFAGGAPFDSQFGASQNCAGGVAPGASCQYFFTFKPTATGLFTTTSNSSTNAGPFVIRLRGTGVGPKLWVTPLELDFGEVGVGQTGAQQAVTVHNAGASPLTDFAGGAPFDTQFGASQNCAGGVAPGASCQYFFTFKPAATGLFTTTSNSSTNVGPFVIQLRGAGFNNAVFIGPRLWVTPLELDFGEVGVGQTGAQQTVTIQNTGSSTLTNFAGGAPFDTQFGASQNCAGGVAPGASCQYFFTFKPTATGVFTTTSNSSTNAGPFVIRLRGTGAGPKLWVTPLALDFGEVGVGQTGAQQTVTIHNIGSSTLTDFAGGAAFDPQFNVSQNCAGGVVPGASCQYFVTFSPAATGVFTTTSNSSTNAGPFVIQLRGQSGVVAPRVDAIFEPASVAPGDTTTLRLSIQNPNHVTTLHGVVLAASLPAGLTIAATPPVGASSACGTPSLGAAPGAGAITLAGATILRGETCQISVPVRAAGGEYMLTTGVVGSDEGGSGNAATAELSAVMRMFIPHVER